jgi:hypothetical protein
LLDVLRHVLRLLFSVGTVVSTRHDACSCGSTHFINQPAGLIIKVFDSKTHDWPKLAEGAARQPAHDVHDVACLQEVSLSPLEATLRILPGLTSIMMCYALCCCRELFNNVACEAYFSDAGALQLLIDLQALLSVFQRYTDRPASYFRELGDAVKLLNLPQAQSEFVRQVRGGNVFLTRLFVRLHVGGLI